MAHLNKQYNGTLCGTVNAMKKAFGAAIVAGAVMAGTAAHADWCHDKVTKKANQTEIAAILATLESVGATNTDAYKRLKAKFEGTKGTAIGQCRDDLSFAQAIADGSVAIATGGLSFLAPGKMMHIDMGEILDGNIFGGPNSFFRKPFG